MPTYTIQAPNGKTYSIDGPAGASQADVQAQVLQRDPTAASAMPAPNNAAPPPEQKSGIIGVINAFKDAGTKFNQDVASNYTKQQNETPLQRMGDFSAPIGAISDAGQLVGGIANAAFGSTPVHLPAKVLGVNVPQWAQNINSKGLTGGDIASLVAPVAAPAIGKGAAAILDAAKSVDTSSAANALSSAGQIVKNAVSTAGDIATSGGKSKAALQSVQAAADSIGPAQHLDDLGESVRTPAIANQTALDTQYKLADTQLRSARDAVAADQANNGIGVSDTDAAKALIAKSDAIVNPDPVTQPDVGYTPTPEVAKLNQRVLDVLQPQTQPVSANDAVRARAAGKTVTQGADGSWNVMSKPDFQTVDELRRYVGQVGAGNVEGYGAIDKVQANGLYKDLSGVLDEYVNGASAPVQANYRARLAAMQPFDNVKTGQKLLGLQKGTSEFATPSSSIPSQVSSGGRSALRQVSAAAGPQPAAALARGLVRNAIASSDGSSTAVSKLVAPGSKLGDIVDSDEGLSAAVKDYIAKAQEAERLTALKGIRNKALGGGLTGLGIGAGGSLAHSIAQALGK